MSKSTKGKLTFTTTLLLASTLWMGCAPASNTAHTGTATGIVNGEPVKANDPLAASTVDLYYVFPGGTSVQNLCTGTVIGDRAILSAAHCFVDAASQIGISVPELVKRVRVGFGLTIITKLGQPGVELIGVDSVTVNPDYKMNDLDNANKGTALYDMSVIHLSAPMPNGTRIVPLLTDMSVLVKGTELVLAGYGLVKGGYFGTPAKSLNKTKVNIDNPAINPTQFSYSVVDSHSACSGDSGGPAFYTDSQGTMFVAGVTSWGDGECKQLGVYTSVPALLSWIKASM